MYYFNALSFKMDYQNKKMDYQNKDVVFGYRAWWW